MSDHHTVTEGRQHVKAAVQANAFASQTTAVTAATEVAKNEVAVEESDHLEPATFGWTRSGYRARLAARLFGEHVHGDY